MNCWDFFYTFLFIMKGHSTFILACLLALWLPDYAQTINTVIVSPTNYQIVGNDLSIQVQASSTYVIDSVVADVQGRKALLVYNTSLGAFTGHLSLTGLVQDTTMLNITTTDANHNLQTVSRQFIYDLPPALTVLEPKSYSTARPGLGVKARCTDSSGACTLKVNVVWGTTVYPFGTFTDSVTTTLDLSAFNGATSLWLEIDAIDNRNQTTVASETIYVETSPYLKEYYAADNEIADFSGQRVFVMNDSSYSLPRVVSLIDSSVTWIPFNGYLPTINDVHLTPTGAVFGGIDSTHGYPGNYAKLYDWNAGGLDSIGDFKLLRAAGNYCAWNNLSSLYMRDLTTKTNQVVTTKTGYFADDLTAGGVVVYTDNSSYYYNIMRYEGGSSAIVGDNSSGSNNSPLTDGKNIVYIKQDPSYNASLYQFDGTANFLLSNLSGRSLVQPMINYQVNNGYVAYNKFGSTNQLNIWIRDSTGNDTQVTFFGSDSYPDLLNSKGDLMFKNNFRYFYNKDSGIKQIGAAYGKLYYQDSTWYVAIGRTLFSINLHPAPNTVQNFSVNDRTDSVCGFTVNGLASHFGGDGTLMTIKITQLPQHGLLRVNNVPVAISQEIKRVDIQHLTYTPAAGFTGVDTIGWNGSNGLVYTPAAAFILVQVNTIAPPSHPVVTGIPSSVCSSGNIEKGVIANFPDTTNGTRVYVALDGTILPLNADSSFSIDAHTQTAGQHTILVAFSNPTGSDTLRVDLTVVAAVTPVVKLSSSLTNITNLSQQVVLTATNTAGGGASPLYTFAWDGGFTNILRAEGASNTCNPDPSTLVVGSNSIYVRMKTSEACFTTQTNADSIVITRSPVTGLVDIDYPGQMINIAPNPFNSEIYVTGLQQGKSYSISLLSSNGQTILQKKVTGQQQTSLNTGVLPKGVYILRVYDLKKDRPIGSARLLSSGQ